MVGTCGSTNLVGTGEKTVVRNAPTHFGTVGYEIVSDVIHGRITATIELPARNLPRNVLLRLRHPDQLPIKSVTVEDETWNQVDPQKEIVRLTGLKGNVKVTVTY